MSAPNEEESQRHSANEAASKNEAKRLRYVDWEELRAEMSTSEARVQA